MNFGKLGSSDNSVCLSWNTFLDHRGRHSFEKSQKWKPEIILNPSGDESLWWQDEQPMC